VSSYPDAVRHKDKRLWAPPARAPLLVTSRLPQAHHCTRRPGVASWQMPVVPTFLQASARSLTGVMPRLMGGTSFSTARSGHA
jgi:hypothetical protein